MRRRIGQVGKRPVITEGLHLNAISRDLYILDTSFPNEDAVIRDAQVRQAGTVVQPERIEQASRHEQAAVRKAVLIIPEFNFFYKC